ncbi:MAG: hypothetical protein JSV15_01005 [Candidatus Bathyarchaeota archaeon]|nr:MAG: hypothetical protein JSV15_01005 [Candidatus Bathyarchaeota archaeon]
MKEQEGNRQKLFIREIFRVLYSPLEAFKEIVKKPDVKGPMLILLITVLVTAGAQYISASKTFFENPTPEADSWTESTSPWISNGVLLNDTDRIVGNYSVKSFSSNDTYIGMKLTKIGPFNCSGDSGYRGLSFRIKWIHQNEKPPSSNATIQLFSYEENRYFRRDLSNNITSSSNEWANLTIRFGVEQSWVPVNSPDWKNITGLEFRLAWLPSDAANLTMKIDDVYFGEYVSPLASDFFTGWLVSSLMGSATDFIVRWILYAGLLLLMIKIFGGKTGPWSALFNVVGYVFAVTMVYITIDALMINMLPSLSFPLKAWSPVAGEEEIGLALWNQIIQDNWGTSWAYNLRYYLPFTVHAWTAALGTIALHFAREFAWKKAAAISVIAYIMLIFLKALIPI